MRKVTEPDTLDKPAGTLWAVGRQPVYIRGRLSGRLGQETIDREPGQVYSLPAHRNPSNTIYELD